MKHLIRKPLQEIVDYYLKLMLGKVLIFFDTETTKLKPLTGQITELAGIAIEPIFKDGIFSYEIIDQIHHKVSLNNKTYETIKLEAIAQQFLQNPVRFITDKHFVGYSEILFNDEFEKICMKMKAKRKGYRTIKANLKMTGYEKLNLDKYTELSVLSKFQNFVDYYKDIIMVAQNAPFDMSFISRTSVCFKGTPVMDTKEIFGYALLPLLQSLVSCGNVEATEIFKNWEHSKKLVPSTSLGVIAPNLGIDASEWHSALADTKMLIDAFFKTLNLLYKYKDETFDFSFEYFKGYQTDRVLLDRYYQKKGKPGNEFPELYIPRKETYINPVKKLL